MKNRYLNETNVQLERISKLLFNIKSGLLLMDKKKRRLKHILTSKILNKNRKRLLYWFNGWRR